MSNSVIKGNEPLNDAPETFVGADGCTFTVTPMQMDEDEIAHLKEVDRLLSENFNSAEYRKMREEAWAEAKAAEVETRRAHVRDQVESLLTPALVKALADGIAESNIPSRLVNPITITNVLYTAAKGDSLGDLKYAADRTELRGSGHVDLSVRDPGKIRYRVRGPYRERQSKQMVRQANERFGAYAGPMRMALHVLSPVSGAIDDEGYAERSKIQMANARTAIGETLEAFRKSRYTAEAAATAFVERVFEKAEVQKSPEVAAVLPVSRILPWLAAGRPPEESLAGAIELSRCIGINLHLPRLRTLERTVDLSMMPVGRRFVDKWLNPRKEPEYDIEAWKKLGIVTWAALMDCYGLSLAGREVNRRQAFEECMARVTRHFKGGFSRLLADVAPRSSLCCLATVKKMHPYTLLCGVYSSETVLTLLREVFSTMQRYRTHAQGETPIKRMLGMSFIPVATVGDSLGYQNMHRMLHAHADLDVWKV